jgi:hypothetical protein
VGGGGEDFLRGVLAVLKKTRERMKNSNTAHENEMCLDDPEATVEI